MFSDSRKSSRPSSATWRTWPRRYARTRAQHRSSPVRCDLCDRVGRANRAHAAPTTCSRVAGWVRAHAGWRTPADRLPGGSIRTARHRRLLDLRTSRPSRFDAAPRSYPFLVHWARLAASDRSGSLLVMNGHFGHAPWHHAATARVVTAQIGALEDGTVGHTGAKVAAPSVFLMGDFNAIPSSRLLRSLTSAPGAGLVDAARSAAERTGPPVTYHWGIGATRLGLTLDYVLARTPLQPKHAEVIDVHDGWLYPSDHHLLVLEFGLPPAARSGLSPTSSPALP